MKFSINVNVGGPRYSPGHISAIARKADELGFYSVGAAERLIMPRVIKSQYPRGSGEVPGIGSAQNTLESLSVISFLAGQTSRIRLTPFVVIPYRNPLLAANRAPNRPASSARVNSPYTLPETSRLDM